MSAPLHSRFRRNFDRDSKIWARYSIAGPAILAFKNKTRVYSFGPNASYELGAFTALDAPDLIEALEGLELPVDSLWVEFDFGKAMEGLFKSGIVASGTDDDRPTRLAFLVGAIDLNPTTSWSAYAYYVFPNGKTFPAPISFEIYKKGSPEIYPNPLEDIRDKASELIGFNIDYLGAGPAYCVPQALKYPRMTADLANRLRIVILTTVAPDNYVQFRSLISEVNGSCRTLLAALVMVGAARPRRYIQNDQLPPNEIVSTEHPAVKGSVPVHEVDLFLNGKYAHGIVTRRQARAVERRKKGLHDVAGHWSYRNRKDGSDPTLCTAAPRHSFEKPYDDKPTEVCIHCGQMRWYRRPHKRGDEAFGIIPPKVYNVHRSAAE